jgi:hypothetical protein
MEHQKLWIRWRRISNARISRPLNFKFLICVISISKLKPSITSLAGRWSPAYGGSPSPARPRRLRPWPPQARCTYSACTALFSTTGATRPRHLARSRSPAMVARCSVTTCLPGLCFRSPVAPGLPTLSLADPSLHASMLLLARPQAQCACAPPRPVAHACA